MNNYIVTQKLTPSQSAQKLPSEEKGGQKNLLPENTRIIASDKEKVQIATPSEIHEMIAKVEGKDTTNGIESFTYGILGMRHPDEVKQEPNDSYSAGQYLKGALAVGTLLLAII
jgi:hypothetical protein